MTPNLNNNERYKELPPVATLNADSRRAFSEEAEQWIAGQIPQYREYWTSKPEPKLYKEWKDTKAKQFSKKFGETVTSVSGWQKVTIWLYFEWCITDLTKETGSEMDKQQEEESSTDKAWATGISCRWLKRNW